MRKMLAALMFVASIVVGVAGCSVVESPIDTLPATMKTYYVTGARTPEAVLLGVDWLKDES